MLINHNLNGSVINNLCWGSVLKYNYKKPHFTACRCRFLLESEGPPWPMPPNLPYSLLFILQGWVLFLSSQEASLDFSPQSAVPSFYHSTYIKNIELCVDLHHLTRRNSRAEIVSLVYALSSSLIYLEGAQHSLSAGLRRAKLSIELIAFSPALIVFLLSVSV